MTSREERRRTCAICGKSFSARAALSAETVRDPIFQSIQADHPQWSRDSFICHRDLARYRAAYVHSLLESEKGELTTLEREVLESLREHELLSENVDAAFDQERSFGERLADRIAEIGGSWGFLIVFALFLASWVMVNSLAMLWQPLDPFPYILLNLILSCLAAVQAPVIMMSQNRQEAKDRLRARHDYQVNLKAELEIRQLHEKVDHLLSHQWERLVEIQEVQLELLMELSRRD
jgi:uncharacterized membrane protein